MFDLKEIRSNPERFDKGWARRGLTAQSPAILDLDEQRRTAQTAMQELQQQRNEASKAIGQAKAKGEDAADAMAKVAEMKAGLQKLEDDARKVAEALDTLLAGLPNIPDDDVPDGEDESSNAEVRKSGNPKRANDIKDHVDLGADLGMMDFETAAKMSGSRFVVLRSGLARLERALAQFMLDTHTSEFGYTEMSVPLLVRDNAMYGTGQLPKFADDSFQTTRGDWLIPTAEVSLTNTVADMILDATDLPLRMVAFSPCFRSEAGAAGKDTRGMIRQHQFWKVELVSITAADQSAAELDHMTGAAESILKKLDIPFRTMLLCAGDMGFGARKTYDLEAWIPAQNAYREISSCSSCGDFQARRMNTRYRMPGEKQTQFAHTLNGSGLATGRALVAVIENYQQADGSIAIPDVLKPYMGGLEKLERDAA